MTTTRLKVAAQVMLAASEGKQVQFRRYAGDKWQDIHDIGWDWCINDYRIKPESREWWLGFDTKGRASVFFVEPSASSLQPGEQLIKVREVIP